MGNISDRIFQGYEETFNREFLALVFSGALVPYLIIWSLVISAVIPDGVLQDTDDYGMGLLLLFGSVFVYPVYAGGIVFFAIMRARLKY